MSNLYNLKLVCEKYIKNNAHHAPYTGESSSVIMRRGNMQLELHPAGLVISGGWMTNWVILYGIGSKWAADGNVSNKAICDRITKLAQSYTDIIKEV